MSSWEKIEGWSDTIIPFYREVVANARDGSSFVEVGNWFGRSLCFLATEIKNSGKRIHVYAVDPGTGAHSHVHRVKKDYGGSIAGELAKNIRGCGVFDFVTQIVVPSMRGAAMFPDGTHDFIFIDGDHRKDHVRADIAAWRPKLKPGGILAGHDYGRSEVTGVVDEIFPQREILNEDVWRVQL
jgi:predicted O-methyltransferase YrrM